MYTSVVFGDRTNLPHLVLATTESHVLVWNLLTNHLVRKMALDRPILFHLKSNMIGVLHSRGAVALDYALTPSSITRLENVSGIASDDRNGKIYVLHSNEDCDNMLTCVKWLQDKGITNPALEENQTDLKDEFYDPFLKDNVKNFESLLNHSEAQYQARINSKQLSHELITPVISDCSASFVKLSMPM